MMKSAAVVSQKKMFSFNDYIAISIFFLYVSVDFFPIFSSYAFADTQWLYLNALNFAVGFYIYFSKIYIENTLFKNFIVSKVIVFYLIFIFLSGISIIGALNLDEGFITIVRYLIVFTSLFLLFILFYDKKHTFLTLSMIISILIFVECWNGLSVFFKNFGKMSIGEMRGAITHHHDNKNIFAANILIKIPFIIFCVIKTKNWRQILFLFIFFTTCFTLLFLGSRAILVGFILQSVVILIGIIVLKKSGKIAFNWKKSIIPMLVIAFSFVTYTVAINHLEKKLSRNEAAADVQSSSPLAIKNTVNFSQESLDARQKFWQSAVISISKMPFFGCGLGNWKIETLQYEQKWNSINVNGVHVHNDFLQVPAETGVLNGIIFILIFAFLIYYNLKTMQKSSEKDQIIFAVLLAGSITGLMIDSFFNFPLSRPTIQIIFVILIVFTLINYFQYNSKISNENKTSWAKSTLFLIIMINFASFYPNYLLYNFFKAIKITKQDNKTLNLSYNEINSLLKDFPSIDETGTPVDDIKINYLIKENKFKMALKLIEASNKLNPYSLYANSLRVDLHNKKMQFDSAVIYAKKVYDLKPNYQIFYERYIQGLSKMKDTANIVNAFDNLNTNTLNSQHFAVTFSCLLKAGYDKTKSYDYIKRGLLLFPANETLLNIQQDFNESNSKQEDDLLEKKLQLKASKTINYSEIEAFYLKQYNLNKTNYVTVENLGICYFQQKKYAKAIRYLKEVVDANVFQNGKAEYVIAICYSSLGNKIMSCDYAKKAYSKNYKDAQNFIQSSCR